MEYYDVIKKLLGPIMPIGETNIDDKRYENLKNTIIVAEKLISDIYDTSAVATRQEYSMKRAAKLAEEFLRENGILI